MNIPWKKTFIILLLLNFWPYYGYANAGMTYRGKPIEQWIALLSDLDPNVRLTAVQSLEAIGPQIIPSLTHVLSSPNSAGRLAAVRILESVGKNGISSLKKGLKSSDKLVQHRSAIALARLGVQDDLVIRLLMQALEDGNSRSNIQVIFTLAKIGNKAKRATPLLIRFLRKNDQSIRSAAVQGLAMIGADVNIAGPELLKSFEREKSPVLKYHLIRSIAKLKYKPAKNSLINVRQSSQALLKREIDKAIKALR